MIPISETAQPWVDGLTIGQALRETAQRSPDSDACVFCQSGTRWTWAELDREIELEALIRPIGEVGHEDQVPRARNRQELRDSLDDGENDDLQRIH